LEKSRKSRFAILIENEVESGMSDDQKAGDKKRSIDRKREASVTIELSDLNDKSPIRKMFSVSDGLYVITDRGIYLMQLADDIDPGRTNIDVPDVHKKVLGHGFESDIVGRILITSLELLDEEHLIEEFPCRESRTRMFNITRFVVEMGEMSGKLQSEVDACVNGGLPSNNRRSIRIPTIVNLDTCIETFIGKADDVRGEIIALLRSFYDGGADKKVFENIRNSIVARHGEASALGKVLELATPLLVRIRNYRNAMEHPSESMRLQIVDFNLRPDGIVEPPTIEVIHAETPQPRIRACDFMRQMVDALVDMTESLVLHLCAQNLRTSEGFEIGIGELPQETREHKASRFSYVIRIGDEIHRLG
jgi:hypothetical protein